jgi:hypothetical protein
MMRTAIASVMLAVGISSTVIADDNIAGGNLFGGPTQTRVICSFFNASNNAVGIINPRVFDQFGTSFPLTINQCDDAPTLAANRTCSVGLDINDQRSWSCRARVSPSKENVRGVLDIRNSSNAVLSSTDLR